MAGQYDRRRFIARLLLLSAAQINGNQGSTNTSCACHAANMTFEQSNRQKQRNKHTPYYVVDSGATLHCINDISLFDSINHDHPPVELRVANGKVLRAHAVGTVKLQLAAEDGSTSEILLHNCVYHPSFSHNLLWLAHLQRRARFAIHSSDVATSATDEAECACVDRVAFDCEHVIAHATSSRIHHRHNLVCGE